MMNLRISVSCLAWLTGAGRGRGAAAPGCGIALLLAGLAAGFGQAAPLTISLTAPPPAESGYFKMGTPRNPAGDEITLDSRSLLWNGKPWVPAMGEFHYSRYPAEEWREELLKMKAGGIDIVATYVFWLHHEEIEGQWDWSGQRHLRRFIEAARDAGLHVVVRLGPWCHGEARNGGLPEWVQLREGLRRRSTDPKFLELVRGLYGQIALQCRGLLWKDGGPIVGVQVDNEYRGPAAYLLALKEIARDCGLDVPVYTRTGWPSLTTPMPVGEIVPLFGVYAEGFWDRELTPMPSRYWAGFHFSALRTDVAIATEMLGNREAKDDADVTKYPYLTCEIGGGMMNSYHRRILVDPRDIEATTMIKVAGGSTLPGYYMYHGGTNPEGKLTTLMEAQNTAGTNYNDLPVKTYDFQAMLGEFGQLRPHYHTQRRLHLFLDDHGGDLAGMVPALPDVRPGGKDDVTTLRWAARSNGKSGFLFVNNYERSRPLPAKAGVQFILKLADGEAFTLPSEPVTVPPDAIFHWPFNLDVHGVTIRYATAQPLTHILEADGTRTLFFAETPGVPAEFMLGPLAAESGMSLESKGRIERENGRVLVRRLKPGRDAAIRVTLTNGNRTQIVLLDQADSLALWKGEFAGRRRVVLARAGVVFDGGKMRVTATVDSGDKSIAVFPAPLAIEADGLPTVGERDGIFRRYPLVGLRFNATPVAVEPVQPAGPAREITKGPIRQAVAMQPTDDDFKAAAVWRVKLPAEVDLTRDPILRFHYAGDVARATLGGRLLTDDFYNGNAFDLGVRRHAPDIEKGELRFAVLPLRKDAPILLAKQAWPEFGAATSHAALRKVELMQATTVTLVGK